MSMKKFAYTRTLYVHEMKTELVERCLCCIPLTNIHTFYFLNDEEGNALIEGESQGLNKAELQTSLRERYYQLVKTEKCPNVENGKHTATDATKIWVDRCFEAGCVMCVCFPLAFLRIPETHVVKSCTKYTYRVVGAGAPVAPGQLAGLGNNVFMKADGSIEIRV